MRGILRVIALVLLAACTKTVDDIATDCTDGVDNDGDGRIDDEDPGCAFNNGVHEAPDPRIDAGIDAGVDGGVDAGAVDAR